MAAPMRAKPEKQGYDRDSDHIHPPSKMPSYGPVTPGGNSPGVDSLLKAGWKGSGSNVADSRLNRGGDYKHRGTRRMMNAPPA